MLEILQYATSSFWVFVGHAILIGGIGQAIAMIISALRGKSESE
jgi:hypothetical protein